MYGGAPPSSTGGRASWPRGRAAVGQSYLTFRIVTLEQMEQPLRERLDALGPAPRAELLHVLMLPTSNAPTGSASSGGTRRLGRSPSSPDRLRGGPDPLTGARRNAARLRGGSAAAGGAGGDVAGERALTGRAATCIIDPCARKRLVAARFGAPSPGRRLSARSASDASPRSLARSTRGASASGSSRRCATARTGGRHSSRSGSHAPC